MAYTEIWTYQDAVEHLLDMYDNEREGRPLRMARRACLEAYRELSMSSDWSYYIKNHILKTEASQTTGTIDYDSTTYTITLTGATFPSNAQYYKIVINDVHYPVATYVDSTHVTLIQNQNPNADLTGAGYTLYRGSYPLPVDCVSIGRIYDVANNRGIDIVRPEDIELWNNWIYRTPSDPWRATIRNDGDYLNSLSLIFSPPPSSIRNFTFLYQRTPRVLKTELSSTGNLAGSVGGTTLTISAGLFSSSHVGGIIRLSGNSDNLPTGPVGGINGVDNLYVEQKAIVSISDDKTSCEVDTQLEYTHSSAYFTISDPLDIELEAMLQAFQRLSEAAFARLTKRDLKHMTERDAIARVAVSLARERDVRSDVNNGIGWYNPFRHVNITDDV